MNILSLFDGMSCARVALERVNIKIDNYYSSEVDKYAMKIAYKNYPSTVQLGDITKLDTSLLPKIDLVCGGSPCQSFSVAGDGSGFDGKSGLFWEFVRVLKEVKPNFFLLENVVMKKEWQNVISEALGVEPIKINSSLVSAQNRNRLYWTNIPNVGQPENRNILLKDILESDVNEKYFYSERAVAYLDRAKINKRFAMYSDNEKSICLTANFSKSLPYNVYVDREKSNCITSTYSHRAPINYNRDDGQIVFQFNRKDGLQEPIDKSLCLNASDWRGLNRNQNQNTVLHINNDDLIKIRRLTPTECERLQTLPINYTEGVSDTQRYKMIGNGWTVDIIAHIFSFINIDSNLNSSII
jgi:DNA-cytosine methyltransferase